MVSGIYNPKEEYKIALRNNLIPNFLIKIVNKYEYINHVVLAFRSLLINKFSKDKI